MDKGINFQTDVKFDHGMGRKEAELRWKEPHHRLMRVEESQLLFKVSLFWQCWLDSCTVVVFSPWLGAARGMHHLV